MFPAAKRRALMQQQQQQQSRAEAEAGLDRGGGKRRGADGEGWMMEGYVISPLPNSTRVRPQVSVRPQIYMYAYIYIYI